MSRYSIDRPWVLIEIGVAWGYHKRIVAVTDKVPPKEMPDIIVQNKVIDLSHFDDYVDQLVNRAKKARGKK